MGAIIDWLLELVTGLDKGVMGLFGEKVLDFEQFAGFGAGVAALGLEDWEFVGGGLQFLFQVLVLLFERKQLLLMLKVLLNTIVMIIESKYITIIGRQ